MWWWNTDSATYEVVQRIEKEVTKVMAKLEEVQASMDVLTADVTAMKDTVTVASGHIDEGIADIQAQAAQIAALAKQIDDLKNSQGAASETDLDALKGVADGLAKQIEASASALSTESDALKNAVNPAPAV